MFPIAYAYPKAKRAVRDLLRRRLFFVRQMSELSVHLQNTNHQYNINDPLASSRMRSPKYEIDSISHFPDVGKFISYCRLVKCAHESAGKREKGGYSQIALEYGINPYTLKKWVESPPEEALNQASQKGIIELESSKSDYTGLIEMNELKSEEPEFRSKDVEIKYG